MKPPNPDSLKQAEKLLVVTLALAESIRHDDMAGIDELLATRAGLHDALIGQPLCAQGRAFVHQAHSEGQKALLALASLREKVRDELGGLGKHASATARYGSTAKGQSLDRAS